MTKLPDPRDLVLTKEVSISNGIKGLNTERRMKLRRNTLRYAT